MRLFFFLFLLYSAVGLIALAAPSNPNESLTAQELSVAQTEISDLEVRRVDHAIVPAKIHIPTIDVEATVEAVPQNTRGHMSVPSRYERAAWYRDGVMPGEEGSAVIAGHLDDSRGKPGVFINLSALVAGDAVYVEDVRGNVQKFIVQTATRYDFKYAPLNELFRTKGERVLRLITCEGLWNAAQKNYEERLVITALLAP